MSIWNSIVSVDWEAFGTKLVTLVKNDGLIAIDAVKEAIVAVKALTGKDFPTLWDALTKEKADVTELEAAIKEQFGLN